ncbi:MAG: hypothetical protein ACQESP_02510 [Candidatus Muiribacteriota bacterium]
MNFKEELEYLKNLSENFSQSGANKLNLKNKNIQIELEKSSIYVKNDSKDVYKGEKIYNSKEKNASINQNKLIEAERVGKFFSLHPPDSEDRIKNGSVIAEGEKIGHIVSMEIVYDIFAPYDLKVKNILVNDADIVEYGQAVFEVEPLKE